MEDAKWTFAKKSHEQKLISSNFSGKYIYNLNIHM